MWPLLFALTASAADCPNPEWILNEAEEFVLNFMLEDATTALGRAEAAFGCSEPAETKVLARFFAAEGMVALLQSDNQGAATAFAAAARIDATVWNADYGAQARTLYDIAAGVSPDTGTMGFLPAPAEYVVWIDGLAASAPYEMPAGVHLVQIGPDEGASLFAKRVEVRPGEQASVATGLDQAAADGQDGGAVKVVQIRPIPPIAEGFAPPFAKGEAGWGDANALPLKWSVLQDIARYDTDGKRAVRQFQGGQRSIYLGFPVAILGGYATYVFGWDLFRGHNTSQIHSTGQAYIQVLTGTGITLAATTFALNALLRKKKRRRAVLDAADRVAAGKAL